MSYVAAAIMGRDIGASVAGKLTTIPQALASAGITPLTFGAKEVKFSDLLTTTK
jgi:histidine ammonia-lyase